MHHSISYLLEFKKKNGKPFLTGCVFSFSKTKFFNQELIFKVLQDGLMLNIRKEVEELNLEIFISI